jgi:flagellar motor switch protein FliG
MQDDMEAMGAVRLKDVDEAQGRMVSTAKDLAARGEIIINKGKADEEMIA